MKNVLKKIIMIFMLVVGRVKKDKILFINFYGKGYGCNPKYIAEELHKRKKKYNLIWAVSNIEDESVPSYLTKVRINSIKYFYCLATSKIIISNVRMPRYFLKKKNQFYIQTWHGSIPIKKIESAAIDKLSDSYINDAKKDSSNIDLIVSNSTFSTKLYKNDFWYNGKIEEIGCPRNDIFFNGDYKKIKNKIFTKYGIPKNKKTIFYAPTFRNDDKFNYFSIDFEKMISELNDEYVVLIRLHPNVVNNNYEYNKNIINVSDYGDMQELLFISDILITDYSSIMFEFIYTNRSTYLYSPDYKEYLDERGLYFKYEDLPFTISKSSNELIKNIKNNKSKLYDSKLNEFIKELDLFDNGSACKKLCDIIEEEIGINRKK